MTIKNNAFWENVGEGLAVLLACLGLCLLGWCASGFPGLK